MKSINFMGDNGFKKALESVGVTASSSISSEKISGCFKYVTADDMCIITGYCGDSHIEVLELPFELRGKKVIAVAGGAFAHLYDLKCAVISKDVVIIGRKAFYKCCSLVNVTIPESVRFIGEMAFCDLRLYLMVWKGFCHSHSTIATVWRELTCLRA